MVPPAAATMFADSFRIFSPVSSLSSWTPTKTGSEVCTCSDSEIRMLGECSLTNQPSETSTSSSSSVAEKRLCYLFQKVLLTLVSIGGDYQLRLCMRLRALELLWPLMGSGLLVICMRRLLPRLRLLSGRGFSEDGSISCIAGIQAMEVPQSTKTLCHLN